MNPVFRRRFAVCALLLILAGIGATKIPISWNYLLPITVTAQEETPSGPGIAAIAAPPLPLTDSEGNTIPRGDAKSLSSKYIQKAYPTARSGKTVRMTVNLDEPVRSENGHTTIVYVYLRYSVVGGSGNPDSYLSQKQTSPLAISSADGANGRNQKTTFAVTLKPANLWPQSAPGTAPRLDTQIFLRDSGTLSDGQLGVPDKTFSLDLLTN